jgi:hypothetical protein
MIALGMIGNFPYAYSSFGAAISAKGWILIAIGEVVYLAIAYGLLRGSEVVRLLWSIWTVGGFLVLLAKAVAASAALQPHVTWLVVISGYKLTTVGLLFVPPSHEFFRKECMPKATQATTQQSQRV